ncbi:MAG: ATP-binding cassette domain-containing protein [Pseudomonadaceae bacterium]|nr:ATP-binding cassette domain-containing protein [Pseudomonadaceae bacterium]
MPSHSKPSNLMVACRDLSFSYDSAVQPLLADVTAHFPAGFTGVIGANGAGKSTLLRLLVGELRPNGGSIEGVQDAVYCEQRTDLPPSGFADFLADHSSDAYQLRGRFGVELDFLTRWVSLSPGECKRAQIAHALWRMPSVLALDEPTNHVDADARDLLVQNLKRYRGVGLVVSHDRALLDALCVQCLLMEPPRVSVYAGGYTEANTQQQMQRESAAKVRDKLTQEHKKLQREMAKRRAQAAGEHKARSKRGLSRKDSDAREKINRARVTDSKAGSGLRQLSGRAEQAQMRLANAEVAKAFETGIWLEGSVSPRDTVLKLAAGELALGDNRTLQWPQLSVKPDDRIAITGANGVGKSTFLRHALGLLNVPQEKVVSLEQEISAQESAAVLEDVRQQDKATLGQIMSIVSRLNSRPERLLGSQQPSPGEVRKLMLAVGIMRAPFILVMDEPTNHLDLPSIQALEAALQHCPCALIVVSHDRHFLHNIGVTDWRIEMDAVGESVLCVD